MNDTQWQLHCPIPIDPTGDRVTLAHGEGGRLTRRFIAEHLLPRFDNPALRALGDAALIDVPARRMAVTTDSFVVSPLFFPGGDIGSLAVFGTVNDLAVSGATPVCLTLSLIIEEGLPMSVLDCVLNSMARAAEHCSVSIVAGDTKVVPRGAADGLFITTTGVGMLREPAQAGPHAIQAGDAILVSGPIGRHGIAVMAARENLQFEPPPASDSAPLIEPCDALRDGLGTGLRTMRDATRGGVSAVLHEWSAASGLTMHVREADVPITAEVRAVCELLGLDPLYVANEGTLLAAVQPELADAALAILRTFSVSRDAARIGFARNLGIAPVTIQRTLGPEQPLDDPAGAPLPRIC